MLLHNKTEKVIIIICSSFLMLTVLKSFYFSHKSGGGDLRSRIVGARLLSTNESPYFYKWKPGDSDYFLDPNNHADWPVNTNISTPAELVLIYPVSQLPYQYVRYIWTALELLAVAVILILLYRNLPNSRMVLFFLLAVGLLSTDVWLLHSERGQKYIFYALGFTLIYAIAKKEKKRYSLLSGIVSGLFVFVRPFMGVLAFAYLLSGKWKLLLGWFIGIIIGTFIFVFPFLHAWDDYFKSMDLWLQMTRGADIFLKNPPLIHIPETVEGMKNITIYTGFNIDSLKSIPEYLERLGVHMSYLMSCLLFCFLSGILTAFFYKQNHKPTLEAVFVFAFILYFFATVSFYIPRNGYGLVQWLFAVPIIVTVFQKNIIALIILFTGMLLLHNFPFYFPYQALIAELIFVYYSIVYLIGPKNEQLMNTADNREQKSMA